MSTLLSKNKNIPALSVLFVVLLGQLVAQRPGFKKKLIFKSVNTNLSGS